MEAVEDFRMVEIIVTFVKDSTVEPSKEEGIHQMVIGNHSFGQILIDYKIGESI